MIWSRVSAIHPLKNRTLVAHEHVFWQQSSADENSRENKVSDLNSAHMYQYTIQLIYRPQLLQNKNTCLQIYNKCKFIYMHDVHTCNVRSHMHHSTHTNAPNHTPSPTHNIHTHHHPLEPTHPPTHTKTRTLTRTRTHAHTHTRTHAHTHKHTIADTPYTHTFTRRQRPH